MMGGLLSYVRALEVIKREADQRKLETSSVDLMDSLGGVLAEDIFSPESVPSFDNSAMDGFAVSSKVAERASVEQPIIFKVFKTVAAGDLPFKTDPSLMMEGASRLGVEIMTGAPIPLGFGFDAVVKIEDVEVIRGLDGSASQFVLRRPLRPGENIRKQGEDFKKGLRVVEKGQRVGPELLMGLASLGVHQIPLFRKPRVAVISTGRELVDYRESNLIPGLIRNSTAPYLMKVFSLLGVDARFYGNIDDEPHAFELQMREVLRSHPDVIVTTGAVSMGKYDFVRSSLESLGAQVLFHKVAIRPGKPLLFARFDNGPVVFGVPGNPISTSVGLRFFVEPFLRRMMGLADEKPYRALLKKSAQKPDGLRCFFKADFRVSPRDAKVEVLNGQASFMVHSLISANAWVVLPEDGGLISEGMEVDVYPLLPGTQSWVPSTNGTQETPTDFESLVWTNGNQREERGCCV